MNIIVSSYGSLAEKVQKELKLSVGENVTFDFLNEKIDITVTSIADEYFSVLTSRKFCNEINGEINLLESSNTFDLPFFDENVLALPLFDGSYKLKFVTAKENL